MNNSNQSPLMGGEEIEELKPCPFCGGFAEKTFIGNEFTKKRSVEVKCSGCHTSMVVGAIRNNLDWCDRKVTEKWNSRFDTAKEVNVASPSNSVDASVVSLTSTDNTPITPTYKTH